MNKMEKKTNMSTITPSVAGKKPLSSKPKIGPAFDEVDIFGDRYNIGKLKPGLAELGFEVRFVNKHLLDVVGGYHQRGWKVFKYSDFVDADGLNHLIDSLEGRHPEGIIQIGHDILAVRPITLGDKHRASIKSRTLKQSGGHEKAAAEGLRETAKKQNAAIKVYEGYEDNE